MLEIWFSACFVCWGFLSSVLGYGFVSLNQICQKNCLNVDFVTVSLSRTLPVQATSPNVDFGTVSSQPDLASAVYVPNVDFGTVSSQLNLASAG